MDLAAAAGLFAEQQSTITKALEKIVAYLEGGGEEYVERHSEIDRMSRADHTRTITSMHDANGNLTWTKDFMNGGQGFEKGFGGPFAEATAAMSRHAYRPRFRVIKNPEASS